MRLRPIEVPGTDALKPMPNGMVTGGNRLGPKKPPSPSIWKGGYTGPTPRIEPIGGYTGPPAKFVPL